MTETASDSGPSGAEPPRGDTIVRLRALMPTLPPASVRIAQAILDDPTHGVSTSISELARRAGTSETSVVRFCRALGFSGYPEFRLTLAREAGGTAPLGEGKVIGSDISPSDDLVEVVEKIAFADAKAVEETARHLDIQTLERVVSAVAEAPRVAVFGAGASAFVAADLQMKLNRIGRLCLVWADVHLALLGSAVLGPDDVAIFISHTGETAETLDVLTEVDRRGVRTVAICNFPQSSLAMAASEVLTTAVRETTFRSGAMASRIAQLTVVDSLFVGVAQRTYTEATDALAATRDAVRKQQRDARRRRGN